MDFDFLLIVIATEAESPRTDARVALGNHEVLVSGVGKSAASTATALRLADGGIDGVISFGVAGAYPAACLAVGDVVVGSEVALVDEGLERGDSFAPFTRPGMTVPGAEWTPTDPVLRSQAMTGSGLGFTVMSGRIATVSVCAGTERLAKERGSDGALVEGMEGAAIALAAGRYDVPFVEIRGISNPCGPRDGAPFDLETAIANASAVLARMGPLTS